MTDDPTITALRTALHAEVHTHHLDPGIAATTWAAAHGSPPRRRFYAAIAATVVGVAAASVAVAITQTSGRAGPATSHQPAASACAGNVSSGALPTWARSSYTGSGPGAAGHVVGNDHQIVAVPFVDLRVRQPTGRHNKVLWIPRHGTGSSPLHVRARLEGTTDTVTRTLPLGPSYVDLPAAGCWLLTLQWSDRHDTLALHYSP